MSAEADIGDPAPETKGRSDDLVQPLLTAGSGSKLVGGRQDLAVQRVGIAGDRSSEAVGDFLAPRAERRSAPLDPHAPEFEEPEAFGVRRSGDEQADKRREDPAGQSMHGTSGGTGR